MTDRGGRTLQQLCDEAGIRVEQSDFDCGTRLTAYAKDGKKLVSVSRECSDEQSPFDLLWDWLACRHLIAPF